MLIDDNSNSRAKASGVRGKSDGGNENVSLISLTGGPSAGGDGPTVFEICSGPAIGHSDSLTSTGDGMYLLVDADSHYPGVHSGYETDVSCSSAGVVHSRYCTDLKCDS